MIRSTKVTQDNLLPSPAAHDLWTAEHRLFAPGIERTETGGWRLSEPVAGCRCVTRPEWPTAEAAAEHFRSEQHWAARHAIRTYDLSLYVTRIETAAGASFASRRRTWPRSQAVHHFSDFAWLWAVGISPEHAISVHEHLGLTEPLLAISYLQILGRRIDADWLAQFADGGIEAVQWVAGSHSVFDVEHPAARLEWYRGGVHWSNIPALLKGPYTLDDVRTLTARTGRSTTATAATLAQWIEVGCTPALADVETVWRLAPHARQVPPEPAIEAAFDAADPRRQLIERTDVGLILAVIGTVPETASVINRGVRSFEEYLQGGSE